MLAQGRVLQFDEVRGYGFIVPDGGGEDVFMHANDLLDEKYLFQAGSEVEFSWEQGDKGPKASEIRLIHQSSSKGCSGRTAGSRTESSSDEPLDEGPEPVEEFRGDLTNALVDAVESLSAAQVRQVRDCTVDLVRRRGWVT